MAFSRINLTTSDDFRFQPYKPIFSLSNIEDSSDLLEFALSKEEICGLWYKITTETSVIDNTAATGYRYLYVYDDGTGNGIAELLITAPTFSEALSGYYLGNKKCIYTMYKDAGVYTKKQRVGIINGNTIVDYFECAGKLKLNNSFTINSTSLNNFATTIYRQNTPPTQPIAIIISDMIAAGFEYGKFYPCVGFIHLGLKSTTLESEGIVRINEIMAYSTTELKITGVLICDEDALEPTLYEREIYPEGILNVWDDCCITLYRVDVT